MQDMLNKIITYTSRNKNKKQYCAIENGEFNMDSYKKNYP